MFVDILLLDSARDFDVEFESLRHREIFEFDIVKDEYHPFGNFPFKCGVL